MDLVQRLAEQRIFMVGDRCLWVSMEYSLCFLKVGCGAIGCELLKLIALLGVGRAGEVQVDGRRTK